MLDTKKGQANALMQIGMTFVFVGIVLAFGVYVNTQIAEVADTGTSTNQSETFANFTWVTLDHRAKGTATLANITDTFPAANVTQAVSGQTTLVRVIVSPMYLAGDYNITYVALDDVGTSALANATEGLGTLSSWLPILAVILAAATVMAYLYSAFRGF